MYMDEFVFAGILIVVLTMGGTFGFGYFFMKKIKQEEEQQKKQ